MLNYSNNPLVTLKNYTITLTPNNEHLNVNGKFHLESNIPLTDNLIEISYLFPKQKVDKLFLKKSIKDICFPHSPELNCLVYENFAFIDINNDSLFSRKRKDFSPIPFTVNFGINSYLENKNNYLENFSDFYLLKKQLNNIQLKNQFDWKNVFIEDKNFSSRYKELNILNKVIFKYKNPPIYSYYPLRMYIDKSKKRKFNLPILYFQNISTLENIGLIDKDSFQGNLSFFNNINEKFYSYTLEKSDFDLEHNINNYWKLDFSSNLFHKLSENVNDFSKAELELNFYFHESNRKELVNLIFYLKDSNNEIEQKDIKNLWKVSFHPEEFNLDELVIDSQWKQEIL